MKTHASGRPRLNRQEIQKRREECYRLFLMGLNLTEIAENLGIDRTNVSRHVDKALQGGSWSGSSAGKRFTGLFQQVYDSTMLALRECWRLYASPESKNKAELLGRVQGCISLLSRFVPDLETVHVNEEIRELAKKMQEERALRDKIQSLQNE